ncbi:MAG: hypothetical protein U0132_05530 [Gemmatimonadaceae bacterium]
MMLSSNLRPRGRRVIAISGVFTGAWLLFPARLAGQSDFYNTDAGRPFRTQDALVVERGALELHLPTLQWSRAGDLNRWRFEPEVALGILPRTQFDIGADLAGTRRGNDSTDADALFARVVHQLNVESLQLPAFAVGLESSKSLHSSGVVWQGLVAATRTVGAMRVHANVRGRAGSRRDVSSDQWELGLAVDRTLPMRHLLVGAEVVAVRSSAATHESTWRGGIGARWQWNVRTSLDGGVARTSGPSGGWQVTAGVSTSVALRLLMGGMR